MTESKVACSLFIIDGGNYALGSCRLAIEHSELEAAESCELVAPSCKAIADPASVDSAIIDEPMGTIAAVAWSARCKRYDWVVWPFIPAAAI